MGITRGDRPRSVLQNENEEAQWPDGEDLKGRVTQEPREGAPEAVQGSVDLRDLWPKERDGSFIKAPGIKENEMCQHDPLTGEIRCVFQGKAPPFTDCRVPGCRYSLLMRMRAVSRARKYALVKSSREGRL